MTFGSYTNVVSSPRRCINQTPAPGEVPGVHAVAEVAGEMMFAANYTMMTLITVDEPHGVGTCT